MRDPTRHAQRTQAIAEGRGYRPLSTARLLLVSFVSAAIAGAMLDRCGTLAHHKSRAHENPSPSWARDGGNGYGAILDATTRWRVKSRQTEHHSPYLLGIAYRLCAQFTQRTSRMP